jgi:hypothetical protein
MTPSPASVARYRPAAGLAAACPPALGEGIALTGSVARGEADDDSDVEIVYWTDVYNVLRVLFALNRTWETDWKWLGLATDGLAIKPERLAEHIHFVFSGADPYERVTACQELIHDTLALLPVSPGILRARTTIEDSLCAGRPTT